MRKTIQKILKKLTYRVLAKQKPNIITVTGSVGKTSTKEGIYFAVKGMRSVRRSLKNYNNELGVPFTVSLWGGKAPGKNTIRWTIVFLRLLYYAIFKIKNYPKWLILEIGSDKPGDLRYLMEMIPEGLLKATVLTAVFGVHLEFFKTLDGVYQEKTTPFYFLAKDGLILANSDNCDIARIKKEFADKAKVISYGFEKPADITAFDFKIGNKGLSFKIKTPRGEFNFLLTQAISAYQCYPILAGLGVALNLGVDIKEALFNLNEKLPMPGRMRLIEGINNSLLIDDTYNSSPEAAKYALKALKDLPMPGRKIAVLGDMLELGPDSPRFHHEIGQIAHNIGIDKLITFGKEAKAMSQEALNFTNHQEVGNYLKTFIKPNDTILIKGSQGVRMEKIVRAVMARPDQADHLLVRQTDEWQ
ncbi:MAG: UDP-N-acetylmuramoyl-tripeptide--D-alanyl-D-alanine ligase [Candidatus Pacebacteria bacterium]|nr:UDP-N-acetylmuramoyl-tripeptide--D-alanyl-D-alanine ligase [Candidatus Paceibacterota bacterium]